MATTAGVAADAVFDDVWSFGCQWHRNVMCGLMAVVAWVEIRVDMVMIVSGWVAR
jgi:hypothetical protein